MPGDLQGAAKYELWTAEEAREKFHVADDFGEGGYGEVKGAISYPAGSLSAYKFVIGVLKLCLPLGLELYTNTPVIKITRSLSSGLWAVETSRGTIKAKRVVLATNGYTAFLAPQFQSSIVPLRGQITAHRPGSHMPSSGLQTTYSFIYANGYEYMIPRPPGSKFAGDIVIGGGLVKAADEGTEEFGNTDDSTVNLQISEYLTATTPRFFGNNWGFDDKEGRVRKEWTGVMGFSGDGFPFVGEVPAADGVRKAPGAGGLAEEVADGERDDGCKKGLWVSASFQGHGMVLCWMCARALVAMMEGKDEQVGLKEWFPDVFRVTNERLQVKFMGRMHTKPMETV